jgi:homoserine dehydrogenase
MKTVNIILMGFGNVGQAFLRVAQEKKELCRIRYGLDVKFYSIFALYQGKRNAYDKPSKLTL